jgi:phytoene/squalene synthetase
MDVTKLRYENWDEVIHYCSYSAMPVGRFVLDVHGESRSTWAANDALCAALQINNHLQDCGKDYRELRRVYIPMDAFAAAGASPEELGAATSSPQLLKCIHDLAARTEALLRESDHFMGLIDNTRLALEVSVINTYAHHIVRLLQQRDPLSERVHLSKAQFAFYGLSSIILNSLRRIGRTSPAGANVRNRDA